jgi:hypothetical protein
VKMGNRNARPKLVENGRGELVTTGHWITDAELERRLKNVAEFHANKAVQIAISEKDAVERPCYALMIALTSAISLVQSGNTKATRSWARTVLAEIQSFRKMCQEKIWNHRFEFTLFRLKEEEFREFMGYADRIIELLQAYAAPEKRGDKRIDEHTALRAYFAEIHPPLQYSPVERCISVSSP